MANSRADIRSALQSMLSGATSAGTNVYSNRRTALWESELPAILIYSNQESATPESQRVLRYIRTLELLIEVRVQATTAVDDDVDDLLGEIEDLIYADPSIGGTVLKAIQTNTEFRVDSDADQDIGVGVLTFECQYIA